MYYSPDSYAWKLSRNEHYDIFEDMKKRPGFNVALVCNFYEQYHLGPEFIISNDEIQDLKSKWQTIIDESFKHLQQVQDEHALSNYDNQTSNINRIKNRSVINALT